MTGADGRQPIPPPIPRPFHDRPGGALHQSRHEIDADPLRQHEDGLRLAPHQLIRGSRLVHLKDRPLMLCDHYRFHSHNHTGEQHPESNRNHPGQPQRPRTRNEAPDTDFVLFPLYLLVNLGRRTGHPTMPAALTGRRTPRRRGPAGIATTLRDAPLAGYPAISRAAVHGPGRRPGAVRSGHESHTSHASHQTQTPASAEPAQRLRLPDDRLVSDSRPRGARPGREMALREDRSAPHPMIAS